MRLKEAKALLDAGLHEGAYYLAGYAVECGLKACIAKKTRRHEFPDKKEVDKTYTHNLEALVGAAGLHDSRRKLADEHIQFSDFWDKVKEWTERSRYERATPESAHALIEAITDRHHGVMTWLRRNW